MNPLPESFVSLLLEVGAREDCPEPLRTGIAEYLATFDDSGLGINGMWARGFDISGYGALGPWGRFASRLYNWTPGTSIESLKVVSINEDQVLDLRSLLPPLPSSPCALNHITQPYE